MKSRLFYLSGAFLILASILLWRAWPRVLLWSVESNLNHAYREHRPFLYRWQGAPSSAVTTPAGHVVPNALGKELAKLRRVEASLGPTARSLQLRARADLLAGQYNEAVSSYRLSRLLSPDDPGLQLELGIAYALRAKSEARPLDYEPALEAMLEASRRTQSSEA